MAGSKTNTWENALLDWQFGGTAITLPGTVYCGLWTSALDDTSTGSTSGEVSAGGYARAAVACNNTNFPAASGGAISNGAAVSFGTASADWGTVSYMGLCTAASAGTMCYWSDLTASKIIQNGDPVVVNAGDLDVTES